MADATCPHCNGGCIVPANTPAVICPHCQQRFTVTKRQPGQGPPSVPTNRQQPAPRSRTALRLAGLVMLLWGCLVWLILFLNTSTLFAVLDKSDDKAGNGLLVIMAMGSTALELTLATFAAAAAVGMLVAVDLMDL